MTTKRTALKVASHNSDSGLGSPPKRVEYIFNLADVFINDECESF